MQSVIQQKLREAEAHHANSEWGELLEVIESLLALDPNNSDILYLKLQALCGLERQNDDLGFLRKLCWYRSTSSEAFWALSQAYVVHDDLHQALVACAFCLSVEPMHSQAKLFLDEQLNQLGYKSLTLHFLTVTRLGHLVVEPDSWFREQQKSVKKENTLHLFISDGKPANRAVFDELKAKLKVVENEFWSKLFTTRPKLLSKDYYQAMPYDLKSRIRGRQIDLNSYQFIGELFSNSKPLFTFDSYENEYKKQVCANFGIPWEEPLVCIHVRDSGYLSAKVSKDTSYHDFRDGNLETYQATIEWLIQSGYTVVRMGKKSNQSINVDSQKYIDLNDASHSHDRDMLDVILLQRCAFLIGTSTGVSDLAASLGCAVLLANTAPYTPYYHGKARLVPKFYAKLTGEKIPFYRLFYENLTLNNGQSILNCVNGHELKDSGIEVIDCNAEDILLATKEFQAVADSGNFRSQTHLQAKYADSLPEDQWFKKSTCWVSNSYLERYRDLFFPSVK